MTQQAKFSGQRLEYFDQATNEHYVPYVIEPAAGATRAMMAFLLAAYDEDEIGGEARTAPRLHPRLAPYKVAVLPLSKKDTLTPLAREVLGIVQQRWMTDYDDTQSIGRRYRRQDEIGTPLAVTVDFESLEDGAVTVRDRTRPSRCAWRSTRSSASSRAASPCSSGRVAQSRKRRVRATSVRPAIIATSAATSSGSVSRPVVGRPGTVVVAAVGGGVAGSVSGTAGLVDAVGGAVVVAGTVVVVAGTVDVVVDPPLGAVVGVVAVDGGRSGGGTPGVVPKSFVTTNATWSPAPTVKSADVSPDAIKLPLRTTIVDVVTGPSVPRSCLFDGAARRRRDGWSRPAGSCREGRVARGSRGRRPQPDRRG